MTWGRVGDMKEGFKRGVADCLALVRKLMLACEKRYQKETNHGN